MNLEKNTGYILLTVKKIVEPIRGFRLFTLEPDTTIKYLAGQYLTLIFTIYGKEVRRSYSLLSSGDPDEPLIIGVKRIENGVVSRLLHDEIKEGDRLKTSGPGGLFTLPPDNHLYKTYMFFAAGSGITPVYSLLRNALRKHPAVNLILIYSNSSKENTLLLRELLLLQEKFLDRLSIVFLFSEARLISMARLNRENLLTFLNTYAKVPGDVLFFICGPLSYMNKVMFILNEYGVPANNIRRENFVPKKIATQLTIPPDTGMHKAEIAFNGTLHKIHIAYPNTILQAARLQNISLPFSCEAGSCGNCVALCTSGNVWHSYNEVLTDKDLQQGKILTCSAYPLNDITITV